MNCSATGKGLVAAMIAAVGSTGLSGCVTVNAPDKPIEINLNIRIEQEVRIRVERDLEQVFADDPELFGLPSGSAPRSGGQGAGRKGSGTQ